MAVKKLKKPTRGSQKQKWRPKLKSKNVEKIQEPVVVKPKQKKTLVIAQEIKFARILASNDKKARAKMLKNLRSWLTVRSKSSFVFTEPEFMRLWKGLYYCMWLSDKPLIQEELAESISHLIFCFEKVDVALLYTSCTLKTLSTEWFGIDHYRMDKFQMLVRRIIRQTFAICKKYSWDEKWVKGVADVIGTILVDPKGSLGFKFHVTEVYMEELAKVSGGTISEDMVTEFLRPFAIYLATMSDGRQISHVTRHIFRYLIFQSDVGMDYMEKFKAWKRAGFPTGNIDAMEKIELSDNEEDEKMIEEESNDELLKNEPLDPRAGNVSVDLPQVPFNPHEISKLFEQYKFHSSSTRKNRRQVTQLINEFKELSKGNMPIGIKEIKIPDVKRGGTNPKVAAIKLIEFQDQLHADSIRHLNRKKKKKLLAMLNDDNDNSFDNGPEEKKQKIESEIVDDSISENTEDIDDSISENTNECFDAEEMIKNKKAKDTEPVSQPKKLTKKTAQKQLQLKNKKTKTKKLRDIKENINAELIDGIDDFENFKNTAMISNKKKKSKHNLNNSWEVSSSECSSIVTSENEAKRQLKTPVVTLPDEKNKSQEKKTNKISSTHPVMKKKEVTTPNQKTPEKTPTTENSASSTKKRVKIVLQRNTAQATSEYFRQLRLSPAIPFDANKKPRVGVLKSTPLTSPLNPFYKKIVTIT